MLMKFIHKLSAIVVFLVLFCISGIFIWVAVSGARWGSLLHVMETGRLTFGFAAGALFCLALIFAISGLPMRKRRQYLSYDKEGGTVSISTDAICDYISKLAGEFPSLIKMKPEVIPAKKTIDVMLKVKVRAGPDIHEMCELMQKRVRETLSAGLGITDVRKVEVSVREIASEQKMS